MYGVVLIVVMVLTGGAIAFIGDKLGTKIGKKRLSIFGLRPRHTSIIITIITGILITALTIGAMAVVSKDVRTALFGMEELNAAITSTREALAKSTQELLAMQTEFERTDAELNTARTEIKNLKSEQEELAAESERLREGNERLEIEKAALTSQNENLASENENLTNANQNLSNTNKELSNANQNLSSQNENLSKTNSELENKNKQLSEFNVNLTADNEKLSNDNAALEERAKNLRDGLIAIREGDIVFRAGEVLATAVINGNQTVEKISEDLNKLANAASRSIAERFGENAGDTSVWIYQPEFQRAVDTIFESKKDIAVRISAAGNLVRGEPISTSLSLYPNEKIYSAGEFIFSHEYEIKSDDDAENILRDFLAEINREAVTRGILADPITGSVGVLDGSQLYELMEKLENSRGKVKLTARARENINTIGPLRLNIKFEQRGKK